MLKRAFLITFLIFLAILAVDAKKSGYCPDFCDSRLFYYHGQISPTGTCLYTTVLCRYGCDRNSCYESEKREISPRIAEQIQQQARRVRGFTAKEYSACPDVCLDKGLHYQGNLKKDVCGYSWEPCEYGCDYSRTQCASSSSKWPRPPDYIYSPPLQQYPFPIETRRRPETVSFITEYGTVVIKNY